MSLALASSDVGRQRLGRQVAVTLLAAGAFTVAVAVPTDLIDTPWFSREIPPTGWSWPSLLVSSVLAGLLAATYVSPTAHSRTDKAPRKGFAGALLTFFAVGCPVCNKVVLLALGSAGAVSWFAPLQPLMVAFGIVALGGALWSRLKNQRSCPLVLLDGGRTRP